MAKMTAAQTTKELERKASLGIKPSSSANNAQYNAIASRIGKSTTTTPSTTTKATVSTPTKATVSTPTTTPKTNTVTSTQKPYETSATMKAQTGTNTSSHIIKASGKLDPNDTRMTVDKDGSWVSDQYGQDDAGTYVLKGGSANNKVYMNDKNKQYFASNYGGSGNFKYDANNKTTYTNETEAMRTDKDYNTLGDVNKFSEGKTQEYVDYGKKYEGMTVDEIQAQKEKASLLERNYINSMDGTMFNDGKFKGVAPVAFTPENMQENLANFVYNDMRKEGIQNFQGVSTKAIDEMLNSSGLAGMIDVNNVNVPYLLEQQIQAQAQANGDSAYLDIDPKAILDALVTNGGLKEGYLYDNETGQISVDPKYTQLGDVLSDKGEALRWYGNEQSWFDQRTRNETVSNQMAETPLELRERYSPQTMTEEMKVDLQTERTIKTELEKLTLQLQELEALEGGAGNGLVLSSGGGVGTGVGTTGNGNTNANTNGYGTYGAGGDSTFNSATGGGRSAVYGTSQNYTNADTSLFNALKRRL